MKMETRLSVPEVVRLLKEQVGSIPSCFRCLLTLNGARYTGTSRVCGNVWVDGFELRNRHDPFTSIRAVGRLAATAGGTTIDIDWKKLWILRAIDQTDDQRRIMGFLAEWLDAKEAEQGAASLPRAPAGHSEDGR
ncbi:MAG: hypothetical protein C0404_10300 [Verrucomicrobia bacterium]|nr:hypothetical protein [Verrucomicrobiota bacterium]